MLARRLAPALVNSSRKLELVPNCWPVRMLTSFQCSSVMPFLFSVRTCRTSTDMSLLMERWKPTLYEFVYDVWKFGSMICTLPVLDDTVIGYVGASARQPVALLDAEQNGG